MFTTLQWILLVYGILLAGGGFMGFKKAGSKASLIAGGISGAIAVISALVATQAPSIGYSLGSVLSLVMTIFFMIRVQKTRKFMPAGMIAAISLVVFGLSFVLV